MYFDEFVNYRQRGASIYAIERLAQLTIQALLDLGAMLAVYMKLPKPETYKGIARLLAEKAGLGDEARELLEQLAGFRNILIHGYASIDRELEEQAFQEMENELPAVFEAVERLIENLRIDPPVLDLSKKLAGVFRRHNVRFAYLFGSRARQGTGRDYDIAVVVEVKSALELGGLLVDIAAVLGVREDQIDLVHLNTAPSHLVLTVLSEGVPIYGDPDEAYYFLYCKYLELLDINSVQLPPLRSTKAEEISE